jgi:hypothetical protein
MKQIHVPIIRWPGGCFADSYDWKDGIGEASKRPRRTNFWEVDPDAIRLHDKGPQLFETNQFGTNEFIRFCKLTGAQPYLAGNLRSLPALEFDHWVEYCNSPAGSATLAEVRAAAGFPEPFNVRYAGRKNLSSTSKDRYCLRPETVSGRTSTSRARFLPMAGSLPWLRFARGIRSCGCVMSTRATHSRSQGQTTLLIHFGRQTAVTSGSSLAQN